ncbi:MAG: two-component system response regulator [Pirellulales bacterium]
MDTRRCVLIVDRSAESREVLRAVFEPRGLQVYSTDAAAEGLDLARRHAPDVIILDPDLGEVPADEVAQAFFHQTQQQPARLVVLGGARLRIDQPHAAAANSRGQALPPAAHSPSTPREYLAKPYHYAPLIRRIEALLAGTPSSGTKAA